MKRVITLSVIVLVIVLGIGAFFSYQNSFATISLEFQNQNSNFSISIYTYDHDSEQAPTDGEKVAGPIQTNTELRIKKGSYIIVSDKNNDYTEIKKELKIENDQKVELKAKYSESRLASILEQEKPEIVVALSTQYPQLNQLFNIYTIQLFEEANWAGVLLQSKSPNPLNNDSLRTVLKKQNDKWQVAVAPPQIIVSSVEKPEVPRSVVDATNSLKVQ